MINGIQPNVAEAAYTNNTRNQLIVQNYLRQADTSSVGLAPETRIDIKTAFASGMSRTPNGRYLSAHGAQKINRLNAVVQTPDNNDNFKDAPRLAAQVIKDVLRSTPQVRSNDLRSLQSEVLANRGAADTTASRIEEIKTEIGEINESLRPLSDRKLASNDKKNENTAKKKYKDGCSESEVRAFLKAGKAKIKAQKQERAGLEERKLELNQEWQALNRQETTERQTKASIDAPAHTRMIAANFDKPNDKNRELPSDVLQEAIGVDRDAGTSEVIYEPKLEAAAQAHANFLAVSQTPRAAKARISHYVDMSASDSKVYRQAGAVGADVSEPSTRAKAVGFDSVRPNEEAWTENIMTTTVSENASTQEINDAVMDAIRTNFVDTGVDTRGHREAYLGDSPHLGIGVSQVGTKIFIVVLFGAQPSDS